MSWYKLNNPAQIWVRKWFVAYCKETLSRVRGKFSGSLKTPDGELTMEYATLATEGKDVQLVGLTQVLTVEFCP